MNRVYCAIGKIFELTQNIENDLGLLCENSEIIKEFSRHAKMSYADLKQVQEDAAYLKEKMQTMTFGSLISVVYESKSLSYDEINELKVLLERRNYFVHEYFKVTKFGISPNEAIVLEEFTALKEYLSKLKKMQGRLQMITSGQVERLNYLMARL